MAPCKKSLLLSIPRTTGVTLVSWAIICWDPTRKRPPTSTVEEPGEKATLTVPYSDEDLAAAGGDPGKLVLSYYDEELGQWIPVETFVDPSTQTLTTDTDHFSDWIVLGQENPSSGFPL